MAVKISIQPSFTEDTSSTGTIKIKINKPEDNIAVEMVARRALNGDIMISEHDLIDIIVSPTKRKVVFSFFSTFIFGLKHIHYISHSFHIFKNQSNKV